MSTTDGKIRPIVWLMGLTPFVVVAAAFAYLLLPDKKPAPQHPTVTAPASFEPAAPVAMDPAPPPQVLPVALPSAVAALPSAPPSSSPLDERREIDALLARPPGSEQWTLEEKNAHRAHLAQDLRRRERQLGWDIAAAHRSGDKATEQAKTETLAHVQQAREVLEAPLPASSGAAPSSDAGLAD